MTTRKRSESLEDDAVKATDLEAKAHAFESRPHMENEAISLRSLAALCPGIELTKRFLTDNNEAFFPPGTITFLDGGLKRFLDNANV